MDAYTGLNASTNTWTSSTVQLDDYKERITYDPNGNIQRYLRNGNSASGINMDSLGYKYISGTNQLRRVSDQVLLTYTQDYEDIENQPASTSDYFYEYDPSGNLTHDYAENLTIQWNPYGKIRQIQGSGKLITFQYDPTGNRVGKTVTQSGQTTSTYYVRDAQGNSLATYSKTSQQGQEQLTLDELHLYGSSRLGLLSPSIIVYPSPTQSNTSSYLTGRKTYELCNHLGNVMATISDLKQAVDIEPDQVTDYFIATVKTQQDYYPFGMLMPGRSYTANSTEMYKYGFNGQEKDDEVYGEGNLNSALFWEYDTRLGRRWNMDPVIKYWMSPFHAFSNNPIQNIDPIGANDDDYKLDRESGGIVKIRETEENTDRIYAENEAGDIDLNNSITVEKGIIANKGEYQYKEKDGTSSETNTVRLSENIADMNRLYKFVATNSNVEWSLCTFQNKNSTFSTLSTENDQGAVSTLPYRYLLKNYKELRLLSQSHSHYGNFNPSNNYPLVPSGFNYDLTISSEEGDRPSYEYDNNEYKGRIPEFYEIFAPSMPNVIILHNSKIVIFSTSKTFEVINKK